MKVYFDTLGCAKNFGDSEMAMGLLEEHGHSVVSTPGEADAIVVNTCGFIDDAKKESIGAIFDMASLRDEGKKLIVSGCLVQRYAAELFHELPEADGFIGVNDYEKLPALLDELSETGERFQSVGAYDPDSLERESEARKLPENPYTAYLRIAEGCDNRCAYCIIPYIRGNYRSRSKKSILREAVRLAEAGTKELVLIAQDTSYYGIDLTGRPMLADLVRSLCQIDGIEWIRIMYAYEDNITDELIAVMASEPKVCHYIDIPLQHASDRVLRDMNRHSTRASMEETLRRLRAAMPDIAIRTTMIVGFPGETEADFAALQEFVRGQRFERLGAFAYSREEGTPAAERDDQVPEALKEERLDALMMEQMQISLEHNQDLIGRRLQVMVDRTDEDGESYIGRTRMDAPEIDNAVIFRPLGDHRPGDLVTVEILDAFDYDLEGREV